MRIIFFRMGIVVALVTLGCNLSGAPADLTPVTVGGGPKTTFNDPLDGARVPLGARKILVHAEDALGIARAEFSVNGKLFSKQESPDPNLKKITFTFAWEPATDGEYLLQARAQNAQGVWGQDTIITIQVEKKSRPGGSATDQPAVNMDETKPLATTQVPPSATPSQTPTLTMTPTSQAITFTPDINPKTFYKLGSGCSPTDLKIDVTVTGNVFSVVAFLKLFDHDTNVKLTEYSDGIAMTPKGGGLFSLTVNSSKFPAAPPYTSAWAGVQFAAENQAVGSPAQTLARSVTYADVELRAVCP